MAPVEISNLKVKEIVDNATASSLSTFFVGCSKEREMEYKLHVF